LTDLLAARSQMGLSLAFHMIFATVGIGMPLLMVIAEGLWMRTGDEMYLTLAKRWAKGTAILFAVGAVSGTVLSFELGLLWPGFMKFAGPIIGMPFSLEGFAFFFEAIFLGIYLYGWTRIGRVAHWLAGVGVALSGMLSGMFVITVNAWMNTPTGFELDAAGAVVGIDPYAAMMNPSSVGQVTHMICAAYLATGLMTAGIHAWYLLKEKGNLFHRRGLAVGLVVAGVATALQPVTGHLVAHAVAHNQPVKLAALEAQWETIDGAPFTIGGWPDEEAEETYYAIEIPKLLSLLAYSDPNHRVMGLKEVPKEDRPPVAVTHFAYQLMLACMGAASVTVGIGALLVLFRRKIPLDTPYLWLVVLTAPAGMVGIEAGWTATEVGRQPWVIHGVMRTADAVTPVTGIQITFLVFTLLYIVLGVMCWFLLHRQFLHSPHDQVEDGT